MTQLALEFERAKEQGPIVAKLHVETMIANLRGRGWQTSKQLGAHTEADKRILRAIAEASEGEILSGQKGYMLTREATPADLQQAGWLKSQGQKMLERWTAIQRVWASSAARRTTRQVVTASELTQEQLAIVAARVLREADGEAILPGAQSPGSQALHVPGALVA